MVKNVVHSIGWAKSRYTVINYILYTNFWATLHNNYLFLKEVVVAQSV